MDPIWAPHVIQNLKDSDLCLYLEFSCTACIPGAGCNVERALQVLYQSNGDIKLAMERLLSRNDDTTRNLIMNDHAVWTEDEVHDFERLIMLHGKNFSHISQDIKSKSVKECVEFYYLWKKSPIRNHSTATTTPASVATSTISSTNNSNTQSPPNEERQEVLQDFPCKVCGRVFLKIKSRSAHMKRHKNER